VPCDRTFLSILFRKSGTSRDKKDAGETQRDARSEKPKKLTVSAHKLFFKALFKARDVSRGFYRGLSDTGLVPVTPWLMSCLSGRRKSLRRIMHSRANRSYPSQYVKVKHLYSTFFNTETHVQRARSSILRRTISFDARVSP